MKSKILKICSSLFICIAMMLSYALPCCALEYKESGKGIRVGWYESGNDANPESSTGAHGYDYEYLQALSQYTGWTYEYVRGTWEECLSWLQEGKIDILGFVSKNDEREKIFAYPSLPMAITNAWLVTGAAGSGDETKAREINGMRVGVVKGNAFNKDFEQYCLRNGYTVQYKEYATLTAISPALEAGEIDAAVVSDEDMTASENGLLKISSNSQYFVTNINNQALLNELESAMMQVHTYCPYLTNDLYQKYFSVNMNGRPSFTSEEREFIKNHPDILVLYDSGWPPVEYYDEKRQDYVGISPDLFRLLSEKCGIRFVYEGSTSGQVLSELKTEDSKNVLTTISYDYAWADEHSVYITQPFISSSIVKLGRNLDSEHPTVAINKNAYFTYLLKNELEGVNTQHFAKQAERLEAVRRGEADYTYVTEDQANYYRSIPKYKDLETQRLVGREQSICISVSKNSDPELIAILSKSIASISHDEMAAIVMNNSVNAYNMTPSDVIYEYRFLLITIIAVILAVIGALVVLNNTKRKNGLKLRESYMKEQEALKHEKAALAAAERASAAKGDFMSRMSHEIRTPLNAVIGYNIIARNEMAEARTDEERRHADMKVMDCLTKSELASKHLLTIINDVLDMSAIESGKIKVAHEQFDFKNMISSLTVLFFSQARSKGVDLDVQFEKPTEEWFIGDQMRINQVLTNLLSNAVKFTPEGGSVKLSIKGHAVDEKTMAFRFEVSDTGIGMTKEYLSHIWTPFEQAEASITRRFGGTGLGLSITKNLVELMGGKINVESESGSGTTFTVELSLERTTQPLKPVSCDFSAINALVADDDVSSSDYIKLLFDRCGAKCMAVTSGSLAVEAFASAQTKGEPFNVCLVDWRMPYMDGLETVKQIRRIAGEDIPIIIVSAYDFSEISKDAEQAGVNMFISKPLFQSSLFDLLANISGNQAPQIFERSKDYDFDGARVLLAEDNKMNMEVARRILESSGLVVDSAWNGQEAIDMFLSSKKGTYLAILMDVHMPEVDGYHATRVIRSSSHPEALTIPIIAMTADAFAEDVTEAHESGMNDHVSKPIDIQTLFDTLKKYIPLK